jgi:hypothetical protein
MFTLEKQQRRGDCQDAKQPESNRLSALHFVALPKSIQTKPRIKADEKSGGKGVPKHEQYREGCEPHLSLLKFAGRLKVQQSPKHEGNCTVKNSIDME